MAQSFDAWVSLTAAGRPVARGTATIPASSLAQAGRGSFPTAATVDFIRVDRDFYLRGNDVWVALLGSWANGLAGRWVRWTAPPEGACSLCQLGFLESRTDLLLGWSPPFTKSTVDEPVVNIGLTRVGATNAVRLQQRGGDLVFGLDVAAEGQPQPLLLRFEENNLGFRDTERYSDYNGHFDYAAPANAVPLPPGR